MDSDSILSPSRPGDGELASAGLETQASGALPPIQLTVKEGGNSLKEMAEDELHASLQLLADRMRSLTGASAASIAIKRADKVLCLVGTGAMASEPGALLRTDRTVINQSINNRQIVCCNNTRNAARADGASYQELGVRALMVAPVVRESETVAVLELLSDRTDAFNDGHGEIIEHLSEAVSTALQHADAGRRALHEITGEQDLDFPIPCDCGSEDGSTKSGATDEIAKIQHCESCGFPVSGGRKLCLDCEEAKSESDDNEATPAFLSELVREQKRGWLQSHFYTIGTLLMVLLTVVMLLLKLR
jgi:hypothetical protein